VLPWFQLEEREKEKEKKTITNSTQLNNNCAHKTVIINDSNQVEEFSLLPWSEEMGGYKSSSTTDKEAYE